MKKFTVLLVFLFILVTTACGSSIPTTTRPANESNDTNQARPTPTSESSVPESTDLPIPYPGAAATAVINSNSADYPAPQEYPTIDPYPAESGTAWVVYPVGIQCEDAAASKYQSEQDVQAGLTAAGITVHDVTTTELMVCSACGCPTSIHYYVEINTSDLNKAISLGWELG